MCFHPSQVASYQRWHWAGDEIVAEPVVPAARTLPGTKQRGYPVDIREFLGITDNAVIRARMSAIREGLDPDGQRRFLSRSPGSFDFRVATVLEHMQELSYFPGSRRADSWLFPQETLWQGGGDCEDLAFLLVALLEASQVSHYCLRVALGRIIVREAGKAARTADHAWVVYMNEGGAWEILEPFAHVQQPGKRAPKKTRPEKAKQGKAIRATASAIEVEYVPHFVFNQDHLWRVRSSDARAGGDFDTYVAEREFWSGFDPTYATSVHNSIYDEALVGMSSANLAFVKRLSLVADANVLAYDPRDHFDFAYIAEGWQRVNWRLKRRDLAQFAYAVHAVADFYAHSTYGDYGRRRGAAQELVPYDPARPDFLSDPAYDFERYAPLPGCAFATKVAAEKWRGRLISGQWWRAYTTYPAALKPALGLRRALPDHDRIAVDGAERGADHLRYDEVDYQFQFADRRRAAAEHIRKIWDDWRR